MPVTIKSNLVKIRDNPNAAYTSMDVISDSTTAARIQQITSAANTAQTQIENKKNAALDSIPSDYTTLSNTVTAEVIAREAADLENQRLALAAFPTDTASGEFVSIPDGADNLPIKQMQVAIEPAQDLHGFDYPWPSGGGKNLCNVTLTSRSVNGITVTVNSNGSITLNGTATANNTFININYVSQTQLTIPVNTPIKFGATVDKGSAVRMQLTTNGIPAVVATLPLTNAGFNISSDYTFSNDVTSNWLRVQVESANTQVDNVTIYPFWCLSSNPLTEWEPYSNICPISGWNGASITVTGKNYQPAVPAANVKGVSIQSNNKGSYNISGMFMSNADYAQQNAPRFHLEPGQYIITCKGATENYTYNFGKFIDGTWSQIANISNVNTGSATSVIFDVESADVEYMGRLRVHYTSNISKVNITNFYPMIQRIDKYKKYDINFSTAAGTIYGGMLTINEDGSGKLNVTRKGITLNSAKLVGVAAAGPYAVLQKLNGVKESGIGVHAENLLCDVYKPVYTAGDRGEYTIYVIDASPVIINPAFVSLDDANSILAEQRPTIIYNLKVPIMYSLTAEQVTTLFGTNNISADTGEIITLDYRADVTRYIAKKLAELQALVLENN